MAKTKTRGRSRRLLAAVFALTLFGAAAPAAHGALNWNTTSYDFGDQEFGVSSSPVTFTLTAICDAGPAACSVPAGGVHSFGAVTAPGADFNIDSTNCAGTLITPVFMGPAAACTATVGFKPSSTGAKTGTLDTATGPDVALTGKGVEAGSSKGGDGKKCKKKKKKKGSGSATAAKKKKKCKKKKK